ncbi:phosphate/phosphite/phosphonate ABC transporter substrate-binding protein [Spirulina sp. 06S082]|uniref:phosphate/phosphite/phosphonate ABC transporter substrate-binding protein n=1 Tax=Spirulina sp. 06S082 TaxID=3110248 RepID=UPI002B1EBAFE|nr:phosphate/phosphite/phosphonate ABC transporter substrate-binding protein [Spirulina sp. 06S082]MEA5471752.1 phosphate/phosphite/phosphonate ABC transporter substrate-binding protein [Spirulina sp. 06S082]
MKRRSFFCYSALFLGSCSSSVRSSTGGAENTQGKKADLPTTLHFAVTDAEGIEELQKDYEPFREALAEVLATKVEFFPVDSFVAATPAMLTGKIDLAWAGPSEYLLLQARAKVIPVVSLNRPDFHAVIAVRGDRGIKSLADLKGKTVDMYKIGSTSTHISGTKILIDEGLEPQGYFKTVMSGNHSLQSLKNGEVDAVVRAAHRYKAIIQAENLSEKDYPIIATSSLLPGDIFVASSQLGETVVAAMRSRMLENQERLLQGILASPGLASKFKDSSLIPVNIADYEAIREVYRAIGQENLIQ